MKQIFGVFNLILCLELIVAPLDLNLNILSSNRVQANECPQGTQFDNILNRCLTSNEVSRVRNATNNCDSVSDSNEKKKCYLQNAESELARGQKDGKVNENNTKLADKSVITAGGAVSVALPLVILAHSLYGKFLQGKKMCSPPSMLLMYSGAGVMLVGEVLSYFNHKSKLKEMDKKWQKITAPSGEGDADAQKKQVTDAQSEAFEMLAQNEESIGSTAKTKFAYYTASTVLFAAGAVMSAIEAYQLKAAYAALAVPSTTAQAQVTINKLTCNTGGDPKKLQDAERKLEEHEDFKSGKFRYGPSSRLPDPKMESLKRTAWNNLKNTKNAFQLVELIKEIESIDYENYSRTSYFGPDEISTLKVLKYDRNIASIIGDALLPKALAKEEGQTKNKIKAGGAVATPLTGNLVKSAAEILSTAKNVDGIPQPELIPEIKETNSKFVDRAIGYPWTRAALNGVFGSWIGIMAADFKKQANISEERAKHLRGIKEDFKHTAGLMQCTSDQRNDPTNPGCFCYTPEGKRNSNRDNSAICQKLWTGTTLVAATDYRSSYTAKSCVNNKDQIDSSCACRATNTCKRVTNVGIGMDGLSPGVFRMLGSATGPANDLMAGNVSAADINTASLSANAAALRKAADKILKKDPQTSQRVEKAEKDLSSSLLAASNGLTLGNSGQSNGLGLESLTPQQAAAELEKELNKKDDGPTMTASASPATLGKSTMPMDEELEFGLTTAGLAAQQDQITGIMAKKMDYGENDINQGSTTNLFELLSNRYMRSGMRRLFDDEGKTKPDLPAETEINP